MTSHSTDGKAPAEDINSVVQANIRKILAGRTPEAYCKERGRVLHYVSGSKKGKRVAARSVRYAITEEQSPRLDLIAAIAAKEGIEPFELLIARARRQDDHTRPFLDARDAE